MPYIPPRPRQPPRPASPPPSPPSSMAPTLPEDLRADVPLPPRPDKPQVPFTGKKAAENKTWRTSVRPQKLSVYNYEVSPDAVVASLFG